GVIAPRHLQAIRATGGRLVAAVDPHDSVGVLDAHDFDVPFFTELERFDRHLDKLRHGPDANRLHYLAVCSPNYLHDAHCRLGLRLGADVICEKPIVINPWNLEPLRELEAETGRRVWTVLQLRLHERLVALREELRRAPSARHDVVLTYVTPRGRWYDVSWKGNAEKSGGIATNIGVHMFDLLVWLFGRPVRYGVHIHESRRMAGFLELEQARVAWFLSVEARDLPETAQQPGAPRTFRSIAIDGTEVEFSTGFADLHTRVYEATLAGRGFGIDDARASIELAHRLRTAELQSATGLVHPFLRR
ncbi:MAG: Gfo/Idh/MocA family oxidoreductase, partial [Labilithrix sp.]|nr:Gfo/Idh/MocA family oxidoreductase [Labilithrix sp.]